MNVSNVRFACIDSSHKDQLQAIVQSFSHDQPDLCLISKDGQQIHTQRSLFCLYSSSVTSYLREVSCCNSTSISVPLSSLSINNLIKVLQSGIATAVTKEELSGVAEAAKILGIDLGNFYFGPSIVNPIDDVNFDDSYIFTMLIKNEPEIHRNRIENDSLSETMPWNDNIMIDQLQKLPQEEVPKHNDQIQKLPQEEVINQNDQIQKLPQEDEGPNEISNKKSKKRTKNLKVKSKKLLEQTIQENLVLDLDNIANKTSAGEEIPAREKGISETNVEEKRTKKSENLKLTCDFCGKMFNNNLNYNRHMKSHTVEKPFSCDQCDKCFTKKNKLVSHQMVSHIQTDLNMAINGSDFIFCQLCDQEFSDRSSLFMHKFIKHYKGVQYWCDECDFKTANKRRLKLHKSAIHKDK